MCCLIIMSELLKQYLPGDIVRHCIQPFLLPDKQLVLVHKTSVLKQICDIPRVAKANEVCDFNEVMTQRSLVQRAVNFGYAYAPRRPTKIDRLVSGLNNVIVQLAERRKLEAYGFILL